MHLKSIFQKPKIMFQKVKNDMGTSCTSILSPSLVTRVQEVASLEIACRLRSLSTCKSILIQISSTTDLLSPTFVNLSLSDGSHFHFPHKMPKLSVLTNVRPLKTAQSCVMLQTLQRYLIENPGMKLFVGVSRGTEMSTSG